jgi:hypothetical protein
MLFGGVLDIITWLHLGVSLWGMPTRRDPLAPDHDCHDVIQLQG